MNKTIAADFIVGDDVTINQNKVLGKVIAIFITRNQHQYNVEYVDNNKTVQTEYFYADQLTAVTATSLN